MQDQSFEHFQRIDAQNRRIFKILLVVVALVLIDGFNRHFRAVQYYDSLPMTLYNFTQSYRDVLINWYSDSLAKSTRRPDSLVIHFEKRYRDYQTLARGYHDITEIPLLESYLNDHLPQLVSGERDFLGYRMDYTIYFIVVLFTPTILLICMFLNIRRLRILWHRLETSSAKLILDLPSFPLAQSKKALRLRLETFAYGFLLFVISSLPSISLIAQQEMLRPIIKSTLRVIPLGLPVLDETYSEWLVRVSDTAAYTHIILFLVNIIICLLIVRGLLSSRDSFGKHKEVG